MTPHVAVIGAGASGTLTAARLLDLGVRVTLIGDEAPGQGTAYRTRDERHLLNVPAGKMSADPSSPDDFVAWSGLAPSAFAPRALYSAYLSQHLAACAGDLTLLADQAISVSPVRCASGLVVEADAVVLALGNAAPCAAWVPPGLASSDRYVSDPWVPGALDEVPVVGDVLLIGSGLSAIDVALTLARPGRTVHLISRSGLLPFAHASSPLPALTPPAVDDVSDLGALAISHLARAEVATGDWRPGMDSLRPVTQAIWASLSAEDKASFVADHGRWWDVHRHRMSPQTESALQALLDAGQVSASQGEIVDLDGEVASLAGGRQLTVAAVVNCTGSQPDVRKVTDPLVRDLLARGLATPGPLGWGFLTDDCGRLGPSLWTLGPLRRGTLFETTAIPEIRCQARDLALQLVADLQPALTL